MASVQKAILAAAGTRTATTTFDSVSIDGFTKDFAAIIVATAFVGAAPTLDVIIEHTIDGTNWFTLCTFTQLTSAGKEIKNITIPVLPTVRAVATLGGTITSATFKVELAYANSAR